MPNDPFALIEQSVQRQTQEELASRSLTAARARLVLGRDAASAFFATLALRMNLGADWSIETMETGGKAVGYNPSFACGLSPDELVGVLAHEVLHCALCHHCRRGSRDMSRWNEACDLAANQILLSANFKLPEGRLLPGEGKYAQLPLGRSAEEYYALLQSEQDEEGPKDQDPGRCGGVKDAGDSPSETSAQETEWKVAVAQAEQAGKTRGELPAGLARSVEKSLRPSADWRQILREFISASAKNDYSWARPNRRFLSQGFYLPGLRSEELGEVIIAVDTSGSVGPEELAVFASELEGILGAFECSATVLYHDATVQRIQTWESSDGPLRLEPVGGGGTDHRPVFEWVEKAGFAPSCLVCMTDLDTVFPAQMPDYPVLWATTGSHSSLPPFGQAVRVSG